MKVYIYTLSDPRNNQIRYVGKTNNLDQRFKDHCNPNYKKANKHKRNWVNSLRKDNLKPYMEVIEETNEFDWGERERYWISQMKTWGFNLVNYTLGGDGCTFGNQTSFKKGHNAKFIIALTKDGKFVKEFLGKKAAEDFCGKKCVDNALSRKLKYAGDYLWLYKEVYERMTKEELEEFISWANSPRKESSNTSTQFGKNHIPWNKGEKCRDDIRKKISEKNKGRVPHNKIKVGKFLNDELIITFDSIKEVINSGFTSINNYLDKNKKDKNKFIWKKIIN